MNTETSVHALIIDTKNKILLTQRADIPLWVMPGGRVEAGESLENALIREIREETGYEVGKLSKVLRTKLGTQDKYVYKAKIIGGKETSDPKEVRDICWATIDNLPIPMSIFEKNRVLKSLSFNGQIIEESIRIDKKREFLNLMKSPRSFLLIMFALIKNKIDRGGFRI